MTLILCCLLAFMAGGLAATWALSVIAYVANHRPSKDR